MCDRQEFSPMSPASTLLHDIYAELGRHILAIRHGYDNYVAAVRRIRKERDPRTTNFKALDIELTTCISRMDTVLSNYKSDVDKIDLEIATYLFTAAGKSPEEAREVARSEIEKLRNRYQVVEDVWKKEKGKTTMWRADNWIWEKSIEYHKQNPTQSRRDSC